MTMETAKIKRLDIGCGNNKMDGCVYMDIDPRANPDIVHDLNNFPYPIEDNTYDEIYAKHIIEHLDDPQQFLRELCRALKAGGRLFLETPHFSSYVAYSEVQHKLFYSYFLIINLLRSTDLEVQKGEITFYKTYRFLGIHFLANRKPRTYERFWTYMFPAENLKFILIKKTGS